MRYIELLSPAKNLECALAAIDHGADAVYMGADSYGARSAAGNSLEDIEAVVRYAHLFNVRIYVTVNTLLYENEKADVLRLIWDLYKIGVDALIVQDVSLLKMDLPPIPLHSSTQMDNCTPEQALWLKEHGYEQMVVARELSLEEIRRIHEAVPDITLEAFIHGALCVSYSGRCYASEYCFGRSANRGECAQFCRLPFTLKDAQDHTIIEHAHLLSLRDLNRSLFIEDLIDVGVQSFKIEGRLKDVSYVKNVTAAYRQMIDQVLKKRKDLARSSLGHEQISFKPDVAESFNRDFTDYFMKDRSPHMANMNTPKSKGQYVGKVKEMRKDHLIVSGTTTFHNGDGLTYFDQTGKLQGFRINRAEGNKLFPRQMPHIHKGAILWRNYNQKWEQALTRTTSKRLIYIKFKIEDVENGFQLSLTREDGLHIARTFVCEHQEAQKEQTETVRKTLAKTGQSIYHCTEVEILFSHNWFIPLSFLTEWRRTMIEQLNTAALELYSTRERPTRDTQASTEGFPGYQGPYKEDLPLMVCKYCIRYELGFCPVHQQKKDYKEPLYLQLADGRRFPLKFDCKRCEMYVLRS